MKLILKPLEKPQNIRTDNISGWKSVDAQLHESASQFTEFTRKANEVNNSAGTSNKKFKRALQIIQHAIEQGKDLTPLIDTKLMIRALGLTLIKEGSYKKAKVEQALLEKIDSIRNVPSPLFVRYMLLFYFSNYDELQDSESLAQWLKKTTRAMEQFCHLHPKLFRSSGAKWLAEESIRTKRELNNLINHLGLENYRTGRFAFVAKNIYYIEQLRAIEPNQPHELLHELQKPDVFNARYDQNNLLGHEVLRILIKRAPSNDIDDSWRNVVMAIAGDPRVPKTDRRYQTWWSQIDNTLIQKVIGWLSGFDLRLFLEALEDFSHNSWNEELQRMFPARKQFLQGLLDKKLVTRARLYLTPEFARYLHKHYKEEHLPEFSTVNTGDKSIIYVQLGSTHLIEGSHSCKLWIYKGLPQDALVFNYAKRSVSYSALTSGMGYIKDKKGRKLLVDNVVHSHPLTWQNKAITAISRTNVNVHPKDVLTEADYQAYKRKFAIDYGY